MRGSIREEEINEVRERNNLVEVISEYISLKKSGRTFKALCPFHKEKTPSFIVDPSKQLYHCFGCGEGGDIYTFVMKIDNLDFPEAVKALADRVGYTLNYEYLSEASRPSRQARIYEANEQAMSFYHQILKSAERGQKAREYLESRGYTAKIMDAFHLGYAPLGWSELLEFLRKKGFSLEELVEAGLVVRGEKGLYDRFRKRVIFPIFDIKGRVIAFGGRVLGDELPKYINSPETPTYHKSSTLYGLSWAKSEVVKTSQALVVEGYTDVLSLYQAGVKNAVATCGIAFTPDHLHLLARFTDHVILVFDADTAGAKATERGLDLLGESKVDIFVASLPGGTDPADFVVTKGGEAFKNLLKEAVPLADFCLEQVFSKYNLIEPKTKAKAASETLPIVAALGSAVAQEEYLKRLAQKLDVSFDSLLLELKRLRGPKRRRLASQSRSNLAPETPRLDAQTLAEVEMLKLLLQYPEESSEALFELCEEHFTSRLHRELFNTIRFKSESKGKSKVEVSCIMDTIENEEIRKLISRLMLEPIVTEARKKLFQDILSKLKEFELQRQINTIKQKLEKLSPIKSPTQHDSLFEELLHLEAVKRDLKSQISSILYDE